MFFTIPHNIPMLHFQYLVKLENCSLEIRQKDTEKVSVLNKQ